MPKSKPDADPQRGGLERIYSPSDRHGDVEAAWRRMLRIVGSHSPRHALRPGNVFGILARKQGAGVGTRAWTVTAADSNPTAQMKGQQAQQHIQSQQRLGSIQNRPPQHL